MGAQDLRNHQVELVLVETSVVVYVSIGISRSSCAFGCLDGIVDIDHPIRKYLCCCSRDRPNCGCDSRAQLPIRPGSRCGASPCSCALCASVPSALDASCNRTFHTVYSLPVSLSASVNCVFYVFLNLLFYLSGLCILLEQRLISLCVCGS